jgi:hypothetical protein
MPNASPSTEMDPKPHAVTHPNPVIIPVAQVVLDGQQIARVFTAEGDQLSNQSSNNTVTVAAVISVLAFLLMVSVGTGFWCWLRQRKAKKPDEVVAVAVTASGVDLMSVVPVIMAIPVPSELSYPKGNDGPSPLRHRPFLSRLAAQEHALAVDDYRAQSATRESQTEWKLVAEEASSS